MSKPTQILTTLAISGFFMLTTGCQSRALVDNTSESGSLVTTDEAVVQTADSSHAHVAPSARFGNDQESNLATLSFAVGCPTTDRGTESNSIPRLLEPADHPVVYSGSADIWFSAQNVDSGSLFGVVEGELLVAYSDLVDGSEGSETYAKSSHRASGL